MLMADMLVAPGLLLILVGGLLGGAIRYLIALAPLAGSEAEDDES